MNRIRVDRRKIKIGFDGIASSLDESLLDMAYTKRAYNVAFKKGMLTGEIGIDRAAGYYPYPNQSRHEFLDFASSKHIKNVFHYAYNNAGTPDFRLVAQLDDGTIWFTKIMSEAGWAQVQNLSLIGDIEAVNYRYNGEDILLLATEDEALYYIKDSTATLCNDAPRFSSVAVHNERVFGCVNGAKTRLWFSDDFDPTNWDVNSEDAGFIEFVDECGNLIKVISFLGYLYVFRDYGIFRLTAYGSQDSFVLKKVFTDTGRIYKHSIAVCGDKIIFLADEGLFAFDGYDVVRIAKEFPEVKNKDEAVGAYLDKRYYLGCKTDVDDEFEIDNATNNVIIIFDIFDKSICMLAGVDVCALKEVKTASGSMLVCVFASAFRNRLGMISESGKLFDANLKKIYESPYSDLGIAEAKTLRELIVKTENEIAVTVKIDGKTFEYLLSAKDNAQKIVVEKSGEKMSVKLVATTKDLKIAPVIAHIDIMRS